jgi:kynureninase
MAPLRASLEIFDEAGMESLRAKSERLTGYLEYLVDRIPTRRFEILTPREPSQRGCQLSIRVHEHAQELFRMLVEQGFVGDYRPPGVIRVAPVPLYNTYRDVWRFARALAHDVGADRD